MQLKIGGVEIKPVGERPARLSMLLWGTAGVGKTTLAATMPGRILHICFDPEGAASLAEFANVDTVDLSNANDAITEQFKNATNPLGLKDALEQYDSIIFDSLTNIEDKTLARGIATTKGATIERPSPGAYGVRSALVIRLIKNVLSVSRERGIHICFIAHEGDPQTDDNGLVTQISLSLGGKLPGKIGIDLSEIWCVYDTGRERRIMVRPARKRSPCKTRMWKLSGEPEWAWTFDAENLDKESNKYQRIDTWFNVWKKTGAKIPLPDTKEFKKMVDEL